MILYSAKEFCSPEEVVPSAAPPGQVYRDDSLSDNRLERLPLPSPAPFLAMIILLFLLCRYHNEHLHFPIHRRKGRGREAKKLKRGRHVRDWFSPFLNYGLAGSTGSSGL